MDSVSLTMPEPKFNKRYDSRRYDSRNLNLRDLEVMHSLEVDRNNVKETAEIVHVSEKTVQRTTKKQAYRDCVIASLGEQGATPETYAKNLIRLMEAKKSVVVRKKGVVMVDDNIVQFNANSEFGDILGVKAPKEYDLKHSMASLSDDELQNELNASVKELNGNIQHSITGTPNAGTIIADTVVIQEPAVVEQSRQPAVGQDDS